MIKKAPPVKFGILIVAACAMCISAYCQDASEFREATALIESRQHTQHQNAIASQDGYDYYNSPTGHRFHLGFGVSVASMLNNNIFLLGGVSFGYDILKSHRSAFTISTKTGVSVLEQMPFAQFQLLADYNLNVGLKYDEPPAFGVYFGGGICYVTGSYLKTPKDRNSADFYGYLFNAGIRVGYFDISVDKVFSLRNPIDQIVNPSGFEINLMLRR